MKKVSSVVWQFFDRLEEDKRCVAVLCKLCDTEYKYFGNTTNLRVHLMKKHPIQWDMRQNSFEGLKSVDDSSLRFDDDESNQSTISSKRRKYSRAHIDKNVRYSLSIRNNSSGATDEDEMPKIEIQRVDVLENSEVENDQVENEDNESTLNLVRQMHDQGSDEEWLEEDYHQVKMFPQKRKRGPYKKIKRETVTPPRQRPTYYVGSSKSPKNEASQFIIEEPRKDEYTVFGEYIANKLRKFKAPRTRGNIQQLITTILWQAEYGLYDDADTVKRVLLSSVQEQSRQEQIIQEQEMETPVEHNEKLVDPNQSSETHESEDL